MPRVEPPRKSRLSISMFSRVPAFPPVELSQQTVANACFRLLIEALRYRGHVGLQRGGSMSPGKVCGLALDTRTLQMNYRQVQGSGLSAAKVGHVGGSTSQE